MNTNNEIQIEHRIPSVAEYQKLRSSANWGKLKDEALEKGLDASL